MTRDRVRTEQRLIDAVHELVIEGGFEQVRINRVSQRARVNKILIYRYFGGLDGLINAYYQKYQPVVTAPPIDLEKLSGATLDEFFQACSNFILAEFRLLRTNPQAQEFLRNDLINNQNGATNLVAFQKEEQIRVMIEKLGELIQSKYGRSFAAIIISGMTMLTFMAHDKRTVMGIDMGTDAGWNEIEAAIERIFYGVSLATKERLGHDVLPVVTLSDSEQPA
ncbi:TetR/AcrR family transcriptional regulator [Fibrella forsythiae]|uniref:TetR/AcrR family transcriptional regulator n=1 Tax=Fibrella forsythiae TaxID=2817061 RepID=A0ABS3JLY8_9BACT|nr:TetR/AcrR family transcriptional regulator [Fibrella forsythiae]MBO0951020.1 TetR/AcrR family transcriptional regulator [Fibrella forsythiae]